MTTATALAICLDKENRVHSSYASNDADLVLISKDGVNFRVHSTVMKIASDVFRDMLQTAMKTEEPIYMDDESGDLEMILNAIYPNGVPLKFSIESFETFWHLLNIADKYSIDRIQNDLKRLLEYRTFLTNYPLECYVLACRFNWENLVQVSSSATLAVDLRSAESKEIMKHLDGIRLLQLYSLHEKRRTLMVDAIRLEYVESRNAENATMMAIRLRHHSKKLALKTTICAAIKHFFSAEMEKCSDGSTVFKAGFWEDEEFITQLGTWNHNDRSYITKELRRILNLLPQKIGDIV